MVELHKLMAELRVREQVVARGGVLGATGVDWGLASETPSRCADLTPISVGAATL